MDLTFKTKRFITTIYIAPTISPQGWITAWKNRHSSWKHGFVCRFLWLGFLFRWGKIPYWQTPRGKLELMIEQANDGDYFLDFINEEQH